MESQRAFFTEWVATPVGAMLIGATAKGVCLAEFCEAEEAADEKARKFCIRNAYVHTETGNDHTAAARLQLSDFFAHKLKIFELKFDLFGTDFQKNVWLSLLNIPVGQTVTYLAQARRLGDVKAIRAVAAANGKNPVAIILPCHRVIGSGGALTGYAGGLARKRALLEFEGALQTLF